VFAVVFAVGSILMVLASSGCSADRFQDSGCASDLECRSDRVCEQNRCIPLTQIDHPSEDEQDPDAGPDVLPDVEGDEPDEHENAISQLVGTWETEVSGTMSGSGGGSIPPPTPSTLMVEITRGQESDVEIEVDFSLLCPLEATVRSEPTFSVSTQECDAGSDSVAISYDNIVSQGSIDAQGELNFDFSADATFNGDVFSMELTFKGPRAD
jgi:hypothetical protein